MRGKLVGLCRVAGEGIGGGQSVVDARHQLLELGHLVFERVELLFGFALGGSLVLRIAGVGLWCILAAFLALGATPGLAFGTGLFEHVFRVFVHVAVEGRDRAARDQPQPVGAGFQQIAVMRNKNDRALIFIDRLDQRRAAVDVEMVGRFVHDQQMRPMERCQPHQQARLFAARQFADARVGFHIGKTHLRHAGADLGFRPVHHQRRDMRIGRAIGVEIVDLVLREKPHFHFRRAAQRARHGLQAAAEQLCEGRLAVAVGAQQADAVVVGNVERQPRKDDALVIADAGAFHRDDRRRQFLLWGGQEERQDVGIHHGGDRLHLRQHFQARLRLAGLGGLGAEPVHEILQMAAVVVLLLLVLELDRLQFAALLVEAGVIALPQRQFRAVEMQDVVADGIEQVAVMADDEDRGGIGLEVFDQPERAFEIEIIGRLVEQQQVGGRKEHGGERHTHPPAAGKFGQRALLRGVVEAQPRQDGARARRRGMGADVDEAGLDLGDAMRIGRGFGLDQQARALLVGFQHEVDQRAGAARRFLLDAAQPRAGWIIDRPVLGGELAGNHAEEGGLAGAVAAHEADAGIGRQGDGRLVEQQSRPQPVGQVVEVDHVAACRPWGMRRQ